MAILNDEPGSGGPNMNYRVNTGGTARLHLFVNVQNELACVFWIDKFSTRRLTINVIHLIQIKSL